MQHDYPFPSLHFCLSVWSVVLTSCLLFDNRIIFIRGSNHLDLIIHSFTKFEGVTTPMLTWSRFKSFYRRKLPKAITNAYYLNTCSSSLTAHDF